MYIILGEKSTGSFSIEPTQYTADNQYCITNKIKERLNSIADKERKV